MLKQKQKGVPAFLDSRMANAKYVIGADECGWGCVAGPIVVAACAIANPYDGPAFRDSKRYSSERLRQIAEKSVKEQASYYHIVTISAMRVKELGPAEALRLAYATALTEVRKRIDPILNDDEILIVVDGSNKVKGFDYPHFAVPKGDDRILACSAASILGKVHRDKYMSELQSKYPEFTFQEHKGYLTAKHTEELKRYGVTNEHRRNIAFVQECLDKTGTYVDEPEWLEPPDGVDPIDMIHDKGCPLNHIPQYIASCTCGISDADIAWMNDPNWSPEEQTAIDDFFKDYPSDDS